MTARAFIGMDQFVDAAEWEALQPLIAELPPDGRRVSAMSVSERLDLAQKNSWDLVAYILSLRTETATTEAVLGTASASE